MLVLGNRHVAEFDATVDLMDSVWFDVTPRPREVLAHEDLAMKVSSEPCPSARSA
jgi:hypothetical protein